MQNISYWYTHSLYPWNWCHFCYIVAVYAL